tara:strand:- start:44 stop:850 length:807 start_codon:yes stop_codon:yes gene_type:complete
MILITGGTSFNSSHFIRNIDEDLIVLLNKTKPVILQDNIIYFENLKELKKSDFCKEVKTIINFASSYNTKNKLVPNFKSSFALLLKLFRMTRNMKLERIINIGSYFQDIKKEKSSSYVMAKNFTDFYFSKIEHKIKYFNLKIGDTYGPHDTRNKIFKHLTSNKKNRKILFSGNPRDLFYLTNISDITNALSYIIKNSELFKQSSISLIKLYGHAITLEELVNYYKSINNLNFELIFESGVVLRPGLKNTKYDFSFLLDAQNIKNLKYI